MFVENDFFNSPEMSPVVIVGGGAAGISLAIRLAELEIPNLILEAGQIAYDPEIQDDYAGEATGDTYFDLDITRLRMLGGSTNHWGGWCRPLDDWDFDPVPSLGVPGWPIKKTDLDPFAERTRDILKLPKISDQPFGDSLFKADFAFSPPSHFSETYSALIQQSSLIKVALQTAVTGLHAEDGKIARVDIVDANGDHRSLSPSFVVVACGGIENSRLLLWSNEISNHPIVAESRSLGRYWMEHPHEEVGIAMLQRDLPITPLPRQGMYTVSIKPELLRRFDVLNASMRLWARSDFSFKESVKRRLCGVAPELLDVANGAAGTKAYCGQRLQAVWEQAPDHDNRVALSEQDRDRFGIPRSHLFWRKTEQDYRTARVAFELIGTHLVQNGYGIVKADRHLIDMGGYPDDSELAGHHHMGGTRMADAPEMGIVDRNLKIHGLSNGYVAGSSVFPRGGHANPTYTIIQLSLRLAEHLSTRLKA